MRTIRLMCLYLGSTALVAGTIECILDLFHWPGLWMFAKDHFAEAILSGLLALVAWKYLPQNVTPPSVLKL
jgi:hypothetical protein